jgi:hypothetical protein
VLVEQKEEEEFDISGRDSRPCLQLKVALLAIT